ncbi:MAG: flagellar basal-body MS-ring/collar protein FliF [Methylococcaceae bacterium]
MSEDATTQLVPTNGATELVAEKPVKEANNPLLKGFNGLAVSRQVGLILGVAFSLAMAIAVVLWSSEADYKLLFASVDGQDVGEVFGALDKLNVDYKVASDSGAIMVPADDIHSLRLKLASQGLPKTNSIGYELLEKESAFGTSKSMEKSRFKRALEGEIALSIASIQNIKSARVLLALPKQSVFIRKRKKPSASVIVNLYPGRTLEKGQVEAILHLVASSVPMLETAQVTIVDQKGRLQNAKGANSEMYLTSKQFEYKKNIEDHLVERIENILIPLVGDDAMRAQLTADVDFSITEKTQELYNPDLPALRSEQTQEEQNAQNGIQGVPGALSNQPPPAGVAPELANGEKTGNNEAGNASSRKSSTRNFELDKTISHTRFAAGDLKRLSVAVVIDNQRVTQADGTVESRPYSPEELNRFTELVQQAVGFDVMRGDRVTVTNAAFRAPDPAEAFPDIPLWEQPWFMGAMKQLVAVLVILFLIFGVLRPTMRGLVAKEPDEKNKQAETEGTLSYDEEGNPVMVDAEGNPMPDAPLALDEPEDLLLLESPQSYEKRLDYIRKLVDNDAKRVSQVIKAWVAVNE